MNGIIGYENNIPLNDIETASAHKQPGYKGLNPIVQKVWLNTRMLRNKILRRLVSDGLKKGLFPGLTTTEGYAETMNF